MILTDSGPLVALIDRKDPNHAACVDAARQLRAEPLVTTWPCVTEAMYLLHRAAGYPAQMAFWKLLRDSRLLLHELDSSALERMQSLMDKYRDRPMDFADASVVAAAEQLATRRLFSLDSDFRVYRLPDGSAFEMIP